MDVLIPTIGRMAYLFSLLLIGYLLVKTKFLNVSSAGVLSKLENMLFIPALVMGTFINQFTVESLKTTWKLFLCAFAVLAVTVPLAILAARVCAKEAYLRRIFTYGLSFSNFGFMGNAVVMAIFPDIFADYLIFTLPFWILIDIWGIPALLIAGDGDKPNVRETLKRIFNPMMIGMLIGMAIGISPIVLPSWISGLVSDVGACMSPLAMLLTGMTVAGISLLATFKDAKLYAVSAFRLLAFPLVGILALYFLPLPVVFEKCIVCVLAMPLGLNTVVVPAAYGRDTSAAAGMALISHLLSCLTIPLVFWLSGALLW